MAEEAKDETKTIPKAINRVVIAVFAIYAALPAVALSALPVVKVHGHYQTLLGRRREQGRVRRRPGARHRQAPAPRPAAARGGDLRRPAGGDDPVHRHQRRDHRRLAARLLDGPAPPGPRAACASCIPSSARRGSGSSCSAAIACLTIIPGQATFLGNMYAFGAMLSFTIAHVSVIRLRFKEPDRDAAVPRARARCGSRGRQLPLFAVLGGLGHVPGVRHRHRAAPRRRRRRRRLADDRDRRLHRLPPPAGPRPDDHHQGQGARPGRRVRGRVRVGASSPSTRQRLRRRGDGHRGPAGGPPAARDPRAGHDRRAGLEPDRRRAARAGGARPSRSSRRPRSRSAGGCPATGTRSGPGRPGAGSSTRRGPCTPAAIVLPMVAHRRRLRPRAGDRAARAAVPGDHRVRAGASSERRPRVAGVERACARSAMASVRRRGRWPRRAARAGRARWRSPRVVVALLQSSAPAGRPGRPSTCWRCWTSRCAAARWRRW